MKLNAHKPQYDHPVSIDSIYQSSLGAVLFDIMEDIRVLGSLILDQRELTDRWRRQLQQTNTDLTLENRELKEQLKAQGLDG